MNIRPLITEKQIKKTIQRLAKEIRRDYAGKTPVLIGCLTGSFVFMSDLIRELGIPLECDFMKLSSYENRTTAGKIRLLLDSTLPIRGRDIILVEDIVDTGASLEYARKRLLKKRPKSFKTCVLIYKESERQTLKKESIDYLGVTIPDVFIVGYGIDCAQKYREMRYIAKVQ